MGGSPGFPTALLALLSYFTIPRCVHAKTAEILQNVVSPPIKYLDQYRLVIYLRS